MNRIVLRFGWALLASAVLLLGCAGGMAPRWRYDEQGEPHESKRYPRHLAVDFRTRFLTQAYSPVKPREPIHEFLTEPQREILLEYGQPEYVRRPFTSRLGETVDEWIYLAQNQMFQFVRGRVVYQGEVSDLERTMIRRGYPTEALMWQADPGIERLLLVYGAPWDLRREVYTFANGRLLFSQKTR